MGRLDPRRREPLDANQMFAMSLANNAVAKGVSRVDSLANTGCPGRRRRDRRAVLEHRSPGSRRPGRPARPRSACGFTPAQSAWGPRRCCRSPTQGPTDAGDGLDASGDVNGDGAVAWVQGAAGARAIVAAQLYQPPGGLHAVEPVRLRAQLPPAAVSGRPVQEPWRLGYQVHVDGVQVAPDRRDPSFRIRGRSPTAHTAGRSWPSIGAGLATRSRPRPCSSTGWRRWCKTSASLGHAARSIKRAARVRSPTAIRRRRRAGHRRLGGRQGDRQLGRPHQLAALRLGSHRSFHTYLRPGRYRITVTVTDKAGNRTRTVTTSSRSSQSPSPSKEARRRARPQVTRRAARIWLARAGDACSLIGPAPPTLRGPSTPPTRADPGALYTDGQSGRYLLGGAWLFRADPDRRRPGAALVRKRRRDRRLVAGDGPQRLQRRATSRRRA